MLELMQRGGSGDDRRTIRMMRNRESALRSRARKRVFLWDGIILPKESYMKSELLNVYAPKYDTGGKFWPIVHNATIFSLGVMHMISIGVFGLKKLPLAASLLVPLPVLTLLFNAYCGNRFFPIFEAYSTESLINKDRQEQSKPEMAEFFGNLETAYRDPALKPMQRSSDAD